MKKKVQHLEETVQKHNELYSDDEAQRVDGYFDLDDLEKKIKNYISPEIKKKQEEYEEKFGCAPPRQARWGKNIEWMDKQILKLRALLAEVQEVYGAPYECAENEHYDLKLIKDAIAWKKRAIEKERKKKENDEKTKEEKERKKNEKEEKERKKNEKEEKKRKKKEKERKEKEEKERMKKEKDERNAKKRKRKENAESSESDSSSSESDIDDDETDPEDIETARLMIEKLKKKVTRLKKKNNQREDAICSLLGRMTKKRKS